jgi:NADPH:quinone reductase-like Zn-dependent oxidoreductase
MRAVTIDYFDAIDAVHVADMPEPAPGPGDVLVRVHAASVGPWDVATVAGRMHEDRMPSFPMILGWDFAGKVERTGPDVEGFRPGDRVLGFTPQAFNGIGAHAELIAVPYALLTLLPNGVDFISASVLPVAALTARLALETGQVAAGTKVLIVGAAGQVGGFATQLARARGATVIASINPKQADVVHRLGVRYRVDRYGDVGAEVRALFPEGVDVALDFAGGSGRIAVLAALRDGGHYVTSVAAPHPHEERVIRSDLIYVQPNPVALSELVHAVTGEQITPRVGEVFDMAHAKRAYQVVAEGDLTGKIVLQISEGG